MDLDRYRKDTLIAEFAEALSSCFVCSLVYVSFLVPASTHFGYEIGPSSPFSADNP